MTKVFTDSEYPQITDGLLQYLEKVYPLAGFMNTRGVEDLERYKGARDVIDHLQALYMSQNKSE